MAETLDMRGRAVAPTPAAVLADPTGRRARHLSRAGKAVAVMFCAWLAGLVLAGLGVLPASIVPLSRQIGGASPPALASAIRLSLPTRSDLVAARPESSLISGPSAAAASLGRSGVHRHASGTRSGGGSGTASHRGAPGSSRGSSRGGGSGSGHGTTTGAAPVAGGGTTGAGHSGSGHGRSGAPGQTRHLTNPGHSKSSSHGRSGSSPGHQRHTTTTTTTTKTAPGKSGSAPGHSGSHGSGRGHRH